MRSSRALAVVAWTSVAAMAAAVALLQLLGDRWWPAILILFGPRWVFAVFLLPPLVLLARSWRRGATPAVVAVALFAFGLMDLRMGWGRLWPVDGRPVRVAEFNMGGSRTDVAQLARWLRDAQPDITILVECPTGRVTSLATTLGWQIRTAGSLCLLSPHQIEGWEPRDQMEFWKRHGSGAMSRASIRLPGRAFQLGVVHLATPRHALDTFGDLSELPSRGPVVTVNQLLRNDESRAARGWIGDPGAVDLVAGDFNLPVESAIYRRYWSGYTNAFSRTGLGTGRTKSTRLFGVRIDHILTGERAEPLRSWTGPDLGSDHRPLVAELVYW